MKEYSEDLFEEKENNLQLKELIFKYLNYWPWFITSIILCLAIAWFYLRYASPIYQVSATVIM